MFPIGDPARQLYCALCQSDLDRINISLYFFYVDDEELDFIVCDLCFEHNANIKLDRTYPENCLDDVFADFTYAEKKLTVSDTVECRTFL